jgi:hypothetical protein
MALPALTTEQREWLRLAIETGSESNFILDRTTRLFIARAIGCPAARSTDDIRL